MQLQNQQWEWLGTKTCDDLIKYELEPNSGPMHNAFPPPLYQQTLGQQSMSESCQAFCIWGFWKKGWSPQRPIVTSLPHTLVIKIIHIHSYLDSGLDTQNPDVQRSLAHLCVLEYFSVYKAQGMGRMLGDVRLTLCLLYFYPSWLMKAAKYCIA